ncbi:hypothetical protein G9A89_004332 [Geosiphon pyriformis]|nr:hypothetical protein G9A89_004332 [Geosiphon pyriformis]
MDALINASANKNVVAYSLNKTAYFIDLFMVLAKNFVLKSWMIDTVDHLDANSGKGALVINFVCYFAECYRSACD